MICKPITPDPELTKRIKESIEAVNKMTLEEQEEMHKAQRASWARSCITNPLYTIENGKVVEKQNND